MNANRFLHAMSASFLVVILVTSRGAQIDDTLDGVISKDGVVYCVRGEQLDTLTNALQLPFEVEVKTNGTFKVGNGKERKLEDDQMIRTDGWLVSAGALIQQVDEPILRVTGPAFVIHGAEGLIQPVFDFVWRRAGRVSVVCDGVAERLKVSMTFSNGLFLAPDGSCVYPSGVHTHIIDGELFRLDGTPIPTKDAATLKNGRVFVQKEASLFPLWQQEIMGMNDGTAVHGDGVIHYRDGRILRLREGQTVLIEGLLTRH